MGKGDIKTKRGKIRAGSFGNRRPRKKTRKITTTKKVATKKAVVKKEETKKAVTKKESPKKAATKKDTK